MKKTLIIALLAVLVLGAFTACNGDVNADLSGGRTITLDIYNAGWTFDNGSKSLAVTIPAGCTKWGDLEDNCPIKVKFNNEADYTSLNLKKFTYNEKDMMYFANNDDEIKLNVKISGPKGYTPSDSVLSNDVITLGATYDLNDPWPQ